MMTPPFRSNRAKTLSAKLLSIGKARENKLQACFRTSSLKRYKKLPLHFNRSCTEFLPKPTVLPKKDVISGYVPLNQK
jgi:hypothetical protein